MSLQDTYKKSKFPHSMPSLGKLLLLSNFVHDLGIEIDP
uniref:Uncharacterized protein n=1 Tax=Arundo donax TaxID=35708 RepID=A0A0A8YZZ1_ARUDO